MIDFFSKAKAAKLLRELVDRYLDMKHENESTGKEVSLCACRPFTRCTKHGVFLTRCLCAWTA